MAALGVRATQCGGVPEDGSDEDHDVQHRIRAGAERRGVQAHPLTLQPQPSEREGQCERHRQEAACQGAPGGVPDQDCDQAAIGASAQDPQREGSQAKGGEQGD